MQKLVGTWRLKDPVKGIERKLGIHGSLWWQSGTVTYENNGKHIASWIIVEYGLFGQKSQTIDLSCHGDWKLNNDILVSTDTERAITAGLFGPKEVKHDYHRVFTIHSLTEDELMYADQEYPNIHLRFRRVA